MAKTRCAREKAALDRYETAASSILESDLPGISERARQRAEDVLDSVSRGRAALERGDCRAVRRNFLPDARRLTRAARRFFERD